MRRQSSNSLTSDHIGSARAARESGTSISPWQVDEMFAVEHKKTAEERAAPLLQPGILARVNAAHCSAGSYSCMIHFCLSNFCRLGTSENQSRLAY